MKKSNIDLLSISSHKIYGPKGIGALYIKKGVRPEVLIHGGGQENNQRSGTENIPGIAGFGKACQIANDNMKENTIKLTKIRDKIIKGVLSQVDEAYLNGDPEKRLPNNINFRFSAIEGESLVLMLDAKGIEASTGSACSSQSLEPSYVLTSLGLEPVNVHGSLRLSLGVENTLEDADKVINDIINVVNTLRSMSPLWNSKNGESDLSIAGDEEYGLSK